MLQSLQQDTISLALTSMMPKDIGRHVKTTAVQLQASTTRTLGTQELSQLSQPSHQRALRHSPAQSAERQRLRKLLSSHTKKASTTMLRLQHAQPMETSSIGTARTVVANSMLAATSSQTSLSQQQDMTTLATMSTMQTVTGRHAHTLDALRSHLRALTSGIRELSQLNQPKPQKVLRPIHVQHVALQRQKKSLH